VVVCLIIVVFICSTVTAIGPSGTNEGTSSNPTESTPPETQNLLNTPPEQPTEITTTEDTEINELNENSPIKNLKAKAGTKLQISQNQIQADQLEETTTNSNDNLQNTKQTTIESNGDWQAESIEQAEVLNKATITNAENTQREDNEVTGELAEQILYNFDNTQISLNNVRNFRINQNTVDYDSADQQEIITNTNTLTTTNTETATTNNERATFQRVGSLTSSDGTTSVQNINAVEIILNRGTIERLEAISERNNNRIRVGNNLFRLNQNGKIQFTNDEKKTTVITNAEITKDNYVITNPTLTPTTIEFHNNKFECFTLSQSASFKDTLNTFEFTPPGYYKLCLRTEIQQSFPELQQCINCGLIDTVNQSHMIKGDITYNTQQQHTFTSTKSTIFEFSQLGILNSVNIQTQPNPSFIVQPHANSLFTVENNILKINELALFSTGIKTIKSLQTKKFQITSTDQYTSINDRIIIHRNNSERP